MERTTLDLQMASVFALAIAMLALSGCTLLPSTTPLPPKPKAWSKSQASAVPTVLSKPTLAMVSNVREGDNRRLSFRVDLGAAGAALTENDPIRWRIEGGEIKSCKFARGVVEVVLSGKGPGKLEFDGFSFAPGPKNDLKPDFTPVTWTATGSTSAPSPAASPSGRAPSGKKPSTPNSGKSSSGKRRTGGGSGGGDKQHSSIDWG